ncbi:MAG: NAD(P)H-dependent oxidoreductase subunit E [Bryobacteraceae bacterium]|jgi:bidirectional [NiFe] hydrogenase diaphorase subunit
MARYHYAGDALIEILHAAQQLYGYLSAPLLKQIARKLRLPPSRVLGVATFYHLFRFVPAAKHTASVCLGTACYTEGAAELADILRKRGWTVDTPRCAGSCGLAPLVVCDGAALSRVTPAQLEKRLEDAYDSRNTTPDSAG